MFVPVITKDMQLFQNGNAVRNSANAVHLKNVRLRAQSLQDSLNKPMSSTTTAGSVKKSVPISASTASVNTPTTRNRVVQRQQRNSHSVGALPTTTSLAIRQKATITAANNAIANNNIINNNNNNSISRSPPKIKTISMLDTICEGSALTITNKENENSEDASSSSSSSSPSDYNNKNNRSTPNLQRFGVRSLEQALNTSSAPGLEKSLNSSITLVAAGAAQSTTNPNNNNNNNNNNKGGIVKWLTNTLKGNKNKEKDMEKEITLVNGDLIIKPDEKPWKSLNTNSTPSTPDSPPIILLTTNGNSNNSKIL